MKKIKKIFVSFIAFFIGIVNKICVCGFDGTLQEFLYGPPQPSQEEINMKILKIISPILLLIIGIGVLINKKLSKKVKAIIIRILVLLGIGIYFLLKYIENNSVF